MGLSTTLANALTGLTAASHRAEIVSSNVANAQTPGYARRAVDLSAQSIGGVGAGVSIDGVSRSLNQLVLNDRRLADAAAGNAATENTFLGSVQDAIGQPGTPGALGDQVDAFDAALVQAASRPDSQAQLQSVLTAATNLTGKLSSLTTNLQQARMNADSSIASQVDDLNRSLSQIDALNSDILAQRSSGNDASALMDQRQQLVDHVATIVPIRETARDNDQIALYTTGGAILLDGNTAKIGFSPVGVITADMTLASGALGGLTINGTPVASGDDGPLGGGTLGAQFAIRDVLAPQIQSQMDALARNLMERFQDTAVDPTLSPGEPGLFTDAGAALDPLAETGLAGRIAVNGLVDPAQGGALWRLRDGLGATAPGNVGDATLLNALHDTLAATRVPASGAFNGTARSATGLAADVLSQVAGSKQSADARQTFTTARQQSLTEIQLHDGVDTDAEMQTLLQVQQAFSANARVIKTVDDLIQQLIGM